MSTPAPDAGLPVSPTNGTLSPLGLKDVAITGGFWAMRQDVNARASIDHCQEWVERSGWVANFDAALNGTLPGARQKYPPA